MTPIHHITHIRINRCTLPGAWYADCIGQVLPVVRVEFNRDPSQGIPEDVYWCREGGQFNPINYVKFSDASPHDAPTAPTERPDSPNPETPTPRIHNAINRTQGQPLQEAYHAVLEEGFALERELAVSEQARREASVRDGNWIDKWGACRVCDGEIPHGHADNCDIYKMEKRERELESELTSLRTTCDTLRAEVEALRQSWNEREPQLMAAERQVEELKAQLAAADGLAGNDTPWPIELLLKALVIAEGQLRRTGRDFDDWESIQTAAQVAQQRIAAYQSARKGGGEPTPPSGYSAEELDRDNPFNAWMEDK